MMLRESAFKLRFLEKILETALQNKAICCPKGRRNKNRPSKWNTFAGSVNRCQFLGLRTLIFLLDRFQNLVPQVAESEFL